MLCKNKNILVKGLKLEDKIGKVKQTRFICTITNDEKGKTLSIFDGEVQFSIPFEPLEKYLS